MRLFLLAGEPSGDRLGAALMRGLRAIAPEVEIHGIGGDAMAAEGLVSALPIERLAVMGLSEVVPRLPELFRLRDRAVAAVVDGGHDVLVTIDSPDFGLRVADGARRANPALRTAHYVAPSVWAWRPRRAERMARVVEHVLALLPFEPPYMEAAGMTCDFVGHPVATAPKASRVQVSAFRGRIGKPHALVLPGSRAGEIARLAPIFGTTLRHLPADMPVVLPTLDHLVPAVRAAVRGWRTAPVVVTAAEDRLAAMASGEVALAASGTVSLELAANGVPMVVAYDMAWFSRTILARMLRVDSVSLVNLLTRSRAVPEFLGRECRAEKMGPVLAGLMRAGPARDAQAAAFEEALDLLGRGDEDPGRRAARSILERFG